MLSNAHVPVGTKTVLIEGERGSGKSILLSKVRLIIFDLISCWKKHPRALIYQYLLMFLVSSGASCSMPCSAASAR